MNFRIIPSEQTPAVPNTEIGDLKEYIAKNQVELDQFLDFARKHDNAIGLAANQVSLEGERYMKRMFAWRYGYPMYKDAWMLVIDPVIHEYLGVKRMNDEGCLTWGAQNLIIAERTPAVKVSYKRMDGTVMPPHVLQGLAAYVWQHEVNHLNGVEEKIVSTVESSPPFRPIKIKLPKPVLERNMQCPCGSNKKFKNCCLRWES